jgi:beta-N-acetylhexosaminidase
MEPPLVKKAALMLLFAAALRIHAAGFWDPLPAGEENVKKALGALADRIVSSLPDEELLGQVFMLGYLGTDMPAEMSEWIRGRKVGGVKIFSRNIKDLASLAAGISRTQELARVSGAGIPLFVATDQEGGWVRHIKAETSVSPGNLALGASGIPRDSYLTGYYLGGELASLGVTMNFAPTVDVYANPQAAVIGPRSFGSDPVKAGLLAEAYVEGMRKAGVLCTAKHFPGHGSADADSHGRLPVVSASLETLRARDLIPYRMLSKGRVAAVMSAHLAFPAVLGDLTPSSLSPVFLKDILRGELGFGGIVITDDMEMAGVHAGGLDTPTACLRALLAGNDMILISHSPSLQEKTWKLLMEKMKTDADLRGSIEASARRIIETKLDFYRSAEGPGPAVFTEGSIPAEGAADFFFQSACRSVSLASSRRIPFRMEAGTESTVLLCGQFEEFILEGKRRYPDADTMLFSFNPFYRSEAEDRVRVAARAKSYDVIIFCLANYNSLEVLEGLEKYASRIIVISALTPVYLSEVPWVETAIAVYGGGADSFRAGFAVLAGDFRPTASIPLDFGSDD